MLKNTLILHFYALNHKSRVDFIILRQKQKNFSYFRRYYFDKQALFQFQKGQHNEELKSTKIFILYQSKNLKQFFIHKNKMSKYMNQRSTSVLRKLKTDLGDEHTFERKIAKAIKAKKQVISKMTTPRNYSSYHPHSSKGFVNAQSNNKSKQKPSIVQITPTFISHMQQNGCFGNFSCINHPKKKGVFEDLHQRDNFYCHECAIYLVKSNIAMIQVSSESLIIKVFLEEQLSKLLQEQHKAKSIIEQYYASLRQTFSTFYKQSHYSLNKNQLVEFGSFQISESINKIIQNLGQIEMCHLKFNNEPQKENISNNTLSLGRESIDRTLCKFSKQRLLDTKFEYNTSLESKNSSFINRSRDNSFYKKGAKPAIPKNIPTKKGQHLR